MSKLGEWLRVLLRRDGDGEAAHSAPAMAASPAEGERAIIEADPRAVCPTDLFDVGWKTDSGVARENNEDAVYVFTGCLEAHGTMSAFGVFMVADGMGGHAGGEEASALALRAAAAELIDGVYVPYLSGSDGDVEQPVIGDVVRNAVGVANVAVARQVPGAGCTLTMGVVLGPRLFLGHVGDSRAYLLREGQAPRVLTKDHSFVQRLVEVGELSADEAAEHPNRNVLYRAVGQPEALDVDVGTRLLKAGDQVLLCSDGLWNLVDDDEIGTIVASAGGAQAACDALVAAANAAGGDDNVTVLLVRTNLA